MQDRFLKQHGLRHMRELVKYNHKKMIQNWYIYITNKYGDKIEAGDDDFFLEHTFESECTYGGNSEENAQWMNDLKKLWKQLDKENRKKTIKYFQNLTAMSKLYFN